MPKQYTIAIIDDDDIYRYTIVKTIESLRVSKKILAFTDAQEALKFMFRHVETPDALPNIILLDLNMPIMDGFDFMDAYENFKPEIKNAIRVFMISSSINPVDIERANENPEISDYITKPISSTKLQRIFSNMENDYES